MQVKQKKQAVLMLAYDTTQFVELLAECDKHGWEDRCVTNSCLQAQQFLRKCGDKTPLVFLRAMNPDEAKWFSYFNDKELRPRNITVTLI